MKACSVTGMLESYATRPNPLVRMAADEERHAELAWRTLAWLIRAKGRSVARAIEDARDALQCELAGASGAGARVEEDAATLTEYGVLAADHQVAIRKQVLTCVVTPCCDALLRRHGDSAIGERA
jgi:hypothetical protein